MIYTGVGSRETPKDVLDLMFLIAAKAAQEGHTLRSGGARGADKAFEAGCDSVRGKKEIYRPHQATPEAMLLAAQFHPTWKGLSEDFKRLHERNSFQVLGINLNLPSDRLICWTPDGCISHAQRTRATGGTGTAISIASANHIMICNLAIDSHRRIMENWVAKEI